MLSLSFINEVLYSVQSDHYQHTVPDNRGHLRVILYSKLSKYSQFLYDLLVFFITCTVCIVPYLAHIVYLQNLLVFLVS